MNYDALYLNVRYQHEPHIILLPFTLQGRTNNEILGDFCLEAVDYPTTSFVRGMFVQVWAMPNPATTCSSNSCLHGHDLIPWPICGWIEWKWRFFHTYFTLWNGWGRKAEGCCVAASTRSLHLNCPVSCDALGSSQDSWEEEWNYCLIVVWQKMIVLAITSLN